MARIYFIFSFLMLFPGQSLAEEIAKISPGGEAIDASFIQPYGALFDFYIQDEAGNLSFSGTWSDKVDHLSVGENTYLRRKVIRYSGEETVQSDLERVMIADAISLVPVSTHQVLGQNLDVLYALHFDGPRATAMFSNASEFEVRTLDLEFDLVPYERSLWATLAMSVPFEDGFSGDLPFVNIGKGGALDWETISVQGQETVEVNGKTFDTWVVLFEQSTWRFWVRKEYPYIVKIDHPFPGDATKRAISFLKE